jgi:hypothetical protein
MGKSISVYGIGIVIGTLIMLAAFGSEARVDEEKDTDWKALMISSDANERAAAREAVLEGRKETIGGLLAIVRSPVEEGEAFYDMRSPRGSAIFLLGKLRAKEAVTDLVGCLIPKEGQHVVLDDFGLVIFNPAASALAEVGLPAVSAVVDVIRNTKTTDMYGVREQCLRIIVAIKGLRGTELLFEDLVGRETDASKLKNLKAAQELLEHPKLRRGFENIDERRQRDWGYY